MICYYFNVPLCLAMWKTHRWPGVLCRSNTIILVLVIALFFIQLHYINLSIQYVPQASRENIVKNKYCVFKMQYIAKTLVTISLTNTA